VKSQFGQKIRLRNSCIIKDFDVKPNLRIIGDVHGNIKKYKSLAEKAEFSIQLGDLGFDYSLLENNFSSNIHKVLAGNHDNYEQRDGVFINQTKHFLGDYGVIQVPNIGDIFFVRGGRSIDAASRVLGVDYWSEEELSYEQANKAIELYKRVEPDFVVSHECPESVINYVSNFDSYFVKPSFTAKLLQAMLDEHKPKVWFFGHHHKRFLKVIDNTEFNCLDELECCDIYECGEEVK